MKCFCLVFQIILYGHLIICLMTFISSILLLFGVYRNRSLYILQWIIVAIACLVIVVAIQIVQVRIIPERGRSYFIITVIIFDFIGLGKLTLLSD